MNPPALLSLVPALPPDTSAAAAARPALWDAAGPELAAGPDVAVAALPMLERLRDTLTLAARFRARCQALAAASPEERWGVPALFYFHPRLQTEWAAQKPPTRQFDTAAARVDPEAAAAWAELPDRLDTAVIVLGASLETRQAARAVPGFGAAVEALAGHHPGVGKLADVMSVLDEEVVRVLMPGTREGFRLYAKGLTNFEQFDVLLAAALAGRGLTAAPPAALAGLYRGDPTASDEPLTATARYQCYRPEALSPEGRLPTGLAGTEHWFWGRHPLRRLPRVNGERLALVAPAPVRATWDAERAAPWVRSGLEVLEVMSGEAVAAMLAGLTGRPVAAPAQVMRRAA